jgi:hypothetical protein
MSSDCCAASDSSRRLTARRLTETSGLCARPEVPRTENCTPSWLASRIAAADSAVAMSDFEGTTSVRMALPPTPVRSMSVTSAPRRAPASAAS